MKRYIAIDLLVAKQHQLKLNDWALLENIHFMCNNPIGVCYASKNTLADILQLSARTIFVMLTKLVERGYIIKNENGFIKVTEKWISISNGNSAKTADTMQKLQWVSAETAVEGMQKLHIKEDIKGSNKRESRAIDFLKENYAIDYEAFLMQNKKQINQFEKFEADFNDTVDIEDLKYTNFVLFGRLRKYARNYIANQHKFNAPTETNVIPIYRRKIS